MLRCFPPLLQYVERFADSISMADGAGTRVLSNGLIPQAFEKDRTIPGYLRAVNNSNQVYRSLLADFIGGMRLAKS